MNKLNPTSKYLNSLEDDDAVDAMEMAPSDTSYDNQQ